MLRIVKQADEIPLVPALARAADRTVPPRSTARLALKILELFSPEEPLLGVSEIGRRIGVHKSNVSRLVAALQAEGFLTRTLGGRYRLGIHLYALGATITRSHSLYQAGLTELCELRMATGESVHLAVLADIDVVHLQRLHSDRFMKRVASSLDPSPTHAASTGKVLLAHAPRETVERVIARGLRRYTSRTITDPDKLYSELARIRARGHAVDCDEFVRGTSSVAVPIFAADRETVAAIAVVAPSDRLVGSRLDNVLRLLMQATARIASSAP
jgi:IclR family KDG regulon transcriptional repressor